MTEIRVEFANIPGTQAALGWAGAHTVVADRPKGRAGGSGLGFNGGQLLALAIGGCFCNDLRYVAEKMGVSLGDIGVTVVLELAGEPLIATGARLDVSAETTDGSDPRAVVDAARVDSTVSNSVARGFPVAVAFVS